jgi:tetratricopeptide (TPR) repeat protein
MRYHHILGRIRTTVARDTYLADTASVPDDQQSAMAEVAALVADGEVSADTVRRRIHQLHASGRLDRVMKLSALGVLAASPRVRDLAEASRLAGQQELVALEEGGPHLPRHRASAHRHRGVIAFLLGHFEVALDWFARALELERSGHNLGNVLACLVRLDDLPAARSLLRDALATDDAVAASVRTLVARDDDLRALRSMLTTR